MSSVLSVCAVKMERLSSSSTHHTSSATNTQKNVEGEPHARADGCVVNVRSWCRHNELAPQAVLNLVLVKRSGLAAILSMAADCQVDLHWPAYSRLPRQAPVTHIHTHTNVSFVWRVASCCNVWFQFLRKTRCFPAFSSAVASCSVVAVRVELASSGGVRRFFLFVAVARVPVCMNSFDLRVWRSLWWLLFLCCWGFLLAPHFFFDFVFLFFALFFPVIDSARWILWVLVFGAAFNLVGGLRKSWEEFFFLLRCMFLFVRSVCNLSECCWRG